MPSTEAGMGYNQGSLAYREASVLGTSPERLVLMLYEHLMVSLRKASSQIREGSIEGKSHSIQRASAIVHELMAALDFEAGGELAERLASLYVYFTRRIADAGKSLDPEPLEEILSLTESLHESWVAAADEVEASGGAPPREQGIH